MLGLVDLAIKKGIEEGIEEGFENIFSERLCPGFDDPEDRCPKPPKRCTCWRVHARRVYDSAPWWKRIFMTRPKPLALVNE